MTVINGTNLLGKDKPPWLIGNPAEAIKLLAVAPAQLTPPRREPPQRARARAWITGLPRRIGARLHRPSDTEARWWHWQVTELRGGFVRSYRDARFDVLRQLHELTARYGSGGCTGPADDSEAPPGA